MTKNLDTQWLASHLQQFDGRDFTQRGEVEGTQFVEAAKAG